MWVLRIYQKREVLPSVYDASVIYRQYFVDEDGGKAIKLADELNESYKNIECSDTYWAEAKRNGD